MRAGNDQNKPSTSGNCARGWFAIPDEVSRIFDSVKILENTTREPVNRQRKAQLVGQKRGVVRTEREALSNNLFTVVDIATRLAPLGCLGGSGAARGDPAPSRKSNEVHRCTRLLGIGAFCASERRRLQFNIGSHQQIT
jgi:hypothetical protein